MMKLAAFAALATLTVATPLPAVEIDDMIQSSYVSPSPQANVTCHLFAENPPDSCHP
jgi:hypothetical protein